MQFTPGISTGAGESFWLKLLLRPYILSKGFRFRLTPLSSRKRRNKSALEAVSSRRSDALASLFVTSGTLSASAIERRLSAMDGMQQLSLCILIRDILLKGNLHSDNKLTVNCRK